MASHHSIGVGYWAFLCPTRSKNHRVILVSIFRASRLLVQVEVQQGDNIIGMWICDVGNKE